MNLSRRMLTKEEEDAVGDEIEVRREDQDKINKFSRLHSHVLTLEEELQAKNKEKEELDDITTELELADEDELVPYKIGDAFFHVPLERAQELLGVSAAKVEQEIEELEDKMGTIREEMAGLKIDLYARFGKTINLET
ncbi:Prefoldin subunit-domain-containing protein [Podospora australis]|uniref:Prefoldin subunit 4 n=1 Tax=Podospora australis TaxID=1536484 RepID=A0AAN7AEY9_9PEZI|nr:Prefoldin subunit-domain-containing protein [Podospora australis]